MEIADIVGLYVQCLEYALPFAIVFFFCDFITTTVLRTAFGGRLTFRGQC